MTTTLRIDFVSDISCPWCAVGLGALEKALERLAGKLQAEIYFQPFELNPNMAPGGQDLGEHLQQKYGTSAEQQARIREKISARGAEVGRGGAQASRQRAREVPQAERAVAMARQQVLAARAKGAAQRRRRLACRRRGCVAADGL